jgi:outer membrane lipoprotein-sorting protein
MIRFRQRPLLAAAASLALATPLFAQAPTSLMKPSPAPPPAAPAPTPAPTPTQEAIAQGRALFSKVVEWLGGPDKIASVKDVRTRGRLTAKTGEGDTTMEVQSAMTFPYHLVQEVDSPFGRVVMVVTPTSAFLASASGTQDLPPAAAAELRKQIVRIPLNLTRNAGDPKLVVSAGGKETIGGVETTALDIAYGATSVRWFVDPATGRILRTSHTAISPDGESVRMVSDYHDYKVVSGFPVAHRLEITSNGQKDQTLIIDEYTFNAGIDPKLFEKPPPPASTTPGHPAHGAPAAPPTTPKP